MDFNGWEPLDETKHTTVGFYTHLCRSFLLLREMHTAEGRVKSTDIEPSSISWTLYQGHTGRRALGDDASLKYKNRKEKSSRFKLTSSFVSTSLPLNGSVTRKIKRGLNFKSA